MAKKSKADKQEILTDLQKAIMSSMDCNITEATEEIKRMSNREAAGEDPEEILFEYGLEPDYLMDLIF